MGPASARLRRIALAFSTVLAAFLLSPLAPLAGAEDGGLGAGGAVFAINYTWVLGLILSFVFGFGLRDYFQKRNLKVQAKKQAAARRSAKPAPKPSPTPVAAPPRP